MEKMYRSKTFFKMAGRKMHTPHPTLLDPPLAIRYKNHQKSPAYFSYLAQLVLLFFTKRQSPEERTVEGVAQRPPLPPHKYAPDSTTSIS